MVVKLTRLLFSQSKLLKLLHTVTTCRRPCHGVTVFGIHKIMREQDQMDFTINKVTGEHQEMVLDMIKNIYLKEHVLVRARNMNLNDDRALDNYFYRLINQGNTMYATAENGAIAGFCLGYASSPVDPHNLRNYAFYRQDPNTKDFLYFMAKMQETPNLWEAFKQDKIFEVKMLAVVPEYRRHGLATKLLERCKAQALKQGLNVIRFDCINAYDHRIAERCMLQCILKYPLHRLRGLTAPFIRQSSAHNRLCRVYVGGNGTADTPMEIRRAQHEIESLTE